MAISKSSLFSQNKPPPLSTNTDASANMAYPKHSSDESFSSHDASADFSGEVNTNNNIPSQETLKRVENFPILDQDGRSIPFKNLYTGPNVTRRVLVIFIRHFYCGVCSPSIPQLSPQILVATTTARANTDNLQQNCQEYVRSLTASITPSSLLSLPTPTFIAIVGCGSPSLISMYQSATNCPFPIYADPTKKLYSELGMLRTLNLGARPEYQRKESLSLQKNSGILDHIDFEDFMRVDLRVGTILDARVNEKAQKPAYVLTIDFGNLGIRTSSAQITKNYTPEDLPGSQVVAVMNFPAKRIAGIKSEVLVLGAYSDSRDVVLLQLTHPVENGSRVA